MLLSRVLDLQGNIIWAFEENRDWALWHILGLGEATRQCHYSRQKAHGALNVLHLHPTSEPFTVQNPGQIPQGCCTCVGVCACVGARICYQVWPVWVYMQSYSDVFTTTNVVAVLIKSTARNTLTTIGMLDIMVGKLLLYTDDCNHTASTMAGTMNS